jgi:hypothetical protein
VASSPRAPSAPLSANGATSRRSGTPSETTSTRRGEPVERVIIDLKQEMRGAGVVDRYVRPGERALAESVIRWCIERYYGSTPRGD